MIRGRHQTLKDEVASISFCAWRDCQETHESQLSEDTIVKTVDTLVQGLPAKNRRVLRMLYGLHNSSEMSVVDIAGTLGVLPAEVETIVAESYKLMKQNLAQTQEWLDRKREELGLIDGPSAFGSTLGPIN